MTDNLLPESFYEEEVRDEYRISRKIKEVWSVQLELLNRFIEVCNCHQLKYWAAFGTLLGVVRHKGYIPWDDDLDVIMPRHDYDVLLSHPEWFSRPAQLHLPNKKEKYYEGWARLQNVNTAVLYPNYKKEGSKQGIYIDIFPLDKPGTGLMYKIDITRIKLCQYIGHAYSYNINPNPLAKMASFIFRIPGLFNPYRCFLHINKISKKYMNKTDGLVTLNTIFDCKREKLIFREEDFNYDDELPFENMMIRVPGGFDRILKTSYGNYMEFPPVEKRGIWHSFLFDTQNSYLSFQK